MDGWMNGWMAGWMDGWGCFGIRDRVAKLSCHPPSEMVKSKRHIVSPQLFSCSDTKPCRWVWHPFLRFGKNISII